MTIRIIDLVLHEDQDRRKLSFDTVLFEDTEKSRTMLATVDSIDFHEPLDRFCRASDVAAMPLGKLRPEKYDATMLVDAIKRYIRNEIKQQADV
jgi:hypothetical protein